MSYQTESRSFLAVGVVLLCAMLVATPAAAQVIKAEVGVDGMT